MAGDCHGSEQLLASSLVNLLKPTALSGRGSRIHLNEDVSHGVFKNKS